MAAPKDSEAPNLPFPIFCISPSVERYMLYDIDVITWLRRTHQILGILVGTLPQIPQQNVFLGLPLELMPEEAKLLVEKGLAFVAVDSTWQQSSMNESTPESRKTLRDALARKGKEAAMAAEKKKLESTEKAMRRLRLDSKPSRLTASEGSPEATSNPNVGEEEPLFVPPPPGEPSVPASRAGSVQGQVWAVTPTTSPLPLPLPPPKQSNSTPKVDPAAYAVFKYLHAHGYYMSPGLRFGCQFMAYPGDPLRYHSHFLAWSAGWDEEIDLLDLIGGGRLGTGVKKGFLVGGTPSEEPRKDAKTRIFCFEWGGM